MFSVAALNMLRSIFRHINSPQVRVEIAEQRGLLCILLHPVPKVRFPNPQISCEGQQVELESLRVFAPRFLVQGHLMLHSAVLSLTAAQEVVNSVPMLTQELLSTEPSLRLPWQEAAQLGAGFTRVVGWNQPSSNAHLRQVLRQTYSLEPLQTYAVHLHHGRAVPVFQVMHLDGSRRGAAVPLNFRHNQEAFSGLGLSEAQVQADPLQATTRLSRSVLSDWEQHPIRTATQHMIGGILPSSVPECQQFLTLPGAP